MAKVRITAVLEKSAVAKLDRLVAEGEFLTRSQAVQIAVRRLIERRDRGRLARECGKLDPRAERTLADIGLSSDLERWPTY